MANIFRPSTWLRPRSNEGEGRSQTAEPDLERRAVGAQDSASISDSRGRSAGLRGARDRIEERAYFLWCEAGCPSGQDVDYWLAAEREILERRER